MRPPARMATRTDTPPLPRLATRGTPCPVMRSPADTATAYQAQARPGKHQSAADERNQPPAPGAAAPAGSATNRRRPAPPPPPRQQRGQAYNRPPSHARKDQQLPAPPPQTPRTATPT